MKIGTFICSLLVCVAMSIQGQKTEFDFEIKQLNTTKDQDDVILTSLSQKSGVILTPYAEDYISNWNIDNVNQSQAWELNSTDIDFKNSLIKKLDLDINESSVIGTICRSQADSSIVFSASSGGRSSIYSYQPGKETVRILKAKGNTSYFHPFLSTDGSQLFFSSNLESNTENYDLFFINKLDEGWSEPIRLHSSINTLENQVFPTWYDDTLYFSSSVNGQLDLYSSARSSQYKAVEKLSEPFNSEQDDFLLHKRNDQAYYLSSNRKGSSDKVFILTKRIKTIGEKMLISGYLACSGNRISNVPVSLVSSFGISMDTDVTDSEGNFLFRGDKLIKRYKLKLEKKDPRIKDCAVLYLTDKNGNVIQKIMINDEGEFTFEIITPDEIDGLNMKSVEDESLLQIELNGQIYENSPGDIGKGEPVRILSEDGDMIALAYTSPEGKFKFSDLSPESEYTIKFDESAKQLKLNMIKNGDVIPVDIVNNEAVYQRIDEENSINLIDDRGKQITIEKDEFFNLQNIFYEINSSNLSEIAKFQLDRFAKFIFNNDEITIELISHTDSQGRAEYNLSLSEKRSQAALNYLISLGVKTERLKAFGMGEKVLLNGCIDGVECTDEEHAINRRTEIRIIVLE